MRCAFILFSMMVYPSFSNEVDSIKAEKRAEGFFVIHEVEEDETLYAIARRYKSSIADIIQYNDIKNNRIEIGQILSVLVDAGAKNEEEKATTSGHRHLIKEGETLYSISKMYGIKVEELKKRNNLTHNSISHGQLLVIYDTEEEKTESKPLDTLNASLASKITSNITTEEKEEPESDTAAIDFKRYLVQAGETWNSIAEKVGVSIERLKDWNYPVSDYLTIGQELLVPKGLDPVEEPDEDEKKRISRLDNYGFERIFEEGIVAVIEDISTKKYLALHRSLPVGKELRVKNIINNFVVYVKVVGRLPDTGINEGLLLRISEVAYQQLGILDVRSRVEVSHYKE